jgi:hypothetical protein
MQARVGAAAGSSASGLQQLMPGGPTHPSCPPATHTRPIPRSSTTP